MLGLAANSYFDASSATGSATWRHSGLKIDLRMSGREFIPLRSAGGKASSVIEESKMRIDYSRAELLYPCEKENVHY